MDADLVGGVANTVLFLVCLGMPALYVVVLGRSYRREFEALYRQLREYGCECDCCCVADQRTEEIAPAAPAVLAPEPESLGRHALRVDRQVPPNWSASQRQERRG